MKENKRKIGIIGSEGCVGKPQVSFWSYGEIYSVFRFDISLVLNSKEAINSCDLAVICVPTPEREDGSCDTSIVEESVKWIEAPVILIKSTIPPGTIDFLRKKYRKRIVHSPAFLLETKYGNPNKFWKDPLAIPFVILGGYPKDRNYVYNLLLPITGSKTFKFMSAKDSEMVKYMSNSFGALKVTWATEIKRVCDASGVNFGEVREAWSLDPSVTKSHTLVFQDKPGFSGACLPKDSRALVQFAEKAGYAAELIKEVLRLNEKFKS